MKPKDCICGFVNSKHGHWCPSFKRLADKKAKRDQIKFEEAMEAAKIMHGKRVAGLYD